MSEHENDKNTRMTMVTTAMIMMMHEVLKQKPPKFLGTFPEKMIFFTFSKFFVFSVNALAFSFSSSVDLNCDYSLSLNKLMLKIDININAV